MPIANRVSVRCPRNWAPALGIAILLSGCATHEKTYQPPDASKVVEAQRHYTQTVGEIRTLSGKAKQQTITARDSAMRITLLATTSLANIRDLLGRVSPEYRGSVQAVLDEVTQLSNELQGLVASIDEIVATQTEIDKRFEQTERDKASVLQSSNDYFANAQTLADDATNERNIRIKAEKALSWYRWHWWGSWIALGAGILLCVIFAILKATGKLAFTGAKIAAIV